MTSSFRGILRSINAAGLLLLGGAVCQAGGIADFDDLTLAPNSFWNGPDPSGTNVQGPYGDVRVGSFISHETTFINRYDLTYGSWGGFAYSNQTDNTTASFSNQFSAYTGTGRGPGADNYGVGFGHADTEPNLISPEPFDPTDPAQLMALPTMILPAASQIAGLYVTNTTYTAFSMLLGDAFTKKFGGVTGNDKDWYKLTAYGTDALGAALAGSVELYLADYRFDDNANDYIVDEWAYMDLSALSGASQIHFNLSSSDLGDYGMNTPAYFAVDDVQFVSQVVPEPSSFVLLGVGAACVGLAAMRRRKAGMAECSDAG